MGTSLEKWMTVVINKPQQQTLGREENLLSGVIISKCSVFDKKKKSQGIQRNSKVWPIQRKKVTETFPETAQAY